MKKPWQQQRARDGLMLRLHGPKGKRRLLKPTPWEKIVRERVYETLGVRIRLYEIRKDDGTTVYQCGGQVPGGSPRCVLSADRRAVQHAFVRLMTTRLIERLRALAAFNVPPPKRT